MATGINKIDRNALVYVKDIGRGAFSTVYQMTWKSPNGSIDVAAKKLNSKDQHELEVLLGLDHPNVIQLIGVVDEGTEFMLILELCEGGSLRSYLEARNGRRLSAKQFFDWAEQAARPLEYLRENKLVHKDVKSDNFMVTSENVIKLGDFGIAKNIDQTIDNATTTASYRWMAPELLTKGILSPKFDIFALAVVLWELWTGRYPWEGLQSPTIIYKVCMANERLPIPEDCPEPIKDLMRRSWQADWKQRPDIIQVLDVIISAAATATQEDRQRQIVAGPWYMMREFGIGPGEPNYISDMTLGPDGDVIIADMSDALLNIYSIDGQYKSSIHTHMLPIPYQTAVSSDNICFMTDGSEHITMYELSGKYKGSWVASCQPSSLASKLLNKLVSPPAPVLRGLAIDHAGDLLLGDCKNHFIYRYRQDGTHAASIKVGIKPWFIAVTSQSTIVIATWDTAPQIISNTGEVLHTLKFPAGESKWHPFHVNSHDGMIFVSMLRTILCYSESGEYLGRPIPGIIDPYGGIAMTPDSKTLLVCGVQAVKVFTNPSIHK